ncbi:MAG: response regulator [Hyphomicrobiaceae bacterium]|nr:response regulator [Hyphomicrobiaceae bacterium]MCC0024112.1 response regulator [Hyphomicrobiaceae bacterium]
MLDMSRLTVLVADPSPHMVKIFRAMLRGFGISRITEATDGAMALEAFKDNLIDIAIVDYALTTINGVELTELLRADEKSANRFVPIIMVSAYTEKWRVVQCRDAGTTEFLRKPFSARDLYDRVVEVVQNPRPFVRSAHYFGPDRRRHEGNGYSGEERRAGMLLEDAAPQASTDQDNIDAMFA